MRAAIHADDAGRNGVIVATIKRQRKNLELLPPIQQLRDIRLLAMCPLR
jgi:hypothetical protein